MKIAVVGGGFTGLASALSLVEKNVDVTIYEGDSNLGGLAAGIQEKNWKWGLEYFYHHVFTNDKDILDLAKRVGQKAIILNPTTTSFLDSKEIQLDSPLSVLKFSKLSFIARIHMGLGLAILKVIPNGLFLEKYKVVDFLPKLIGAEGYKVIWEKLLKAKFSNAASNVNMAWFWTRVAKRTQKLGYFEGGFQSLANMTGKKIVELGGKILMNTKVEKIFKIDDGKWQVDDEKFDGVIVTTPAPVAEKILENKIISFPDITYLWGQTIVLELSERLIKGYWMNVLETNWPFLVAVEHTNMIDKKNYGNNRIVYLGNYLPEDSKQLKMTKEELISLYLPYLRKINKGFKKKWIKNTYIFREPFAQPVFPVNYSSSIPKMKTEHRGLYLANMSMVYPYDRGTNYAVMMGNEVARSVLNDLR